MRFFNSYRAWRLLLGACALLAASPAAYPSGYLDFQGASSFQTSGNTVSINIDRIVNNSSTYTSGSLRIDLWATSSRYGGGTIYGQKTASVRTANVSGGSDRLEPHAYFYNITLTNLPYTPPPAGYVYYTLVLSEYSSSCTSPEGFCIAAYLNYSGTYNPPPPPAQNYTVSGTLRDRNNAAIAGATLGLSDGVRAFTTTTDAAGNFSLTFDRTGMTTVAYVFIQPGYALLASTFDLDSGTGRNLGVLYMDREGGEPPGPLPARVKKNDFNGDGKSDILWRHTNGNNAIWLMNGTTLASGSLTTSVADSGWTIQGTGDFDGDGKADILWRHADGRNAIWLMNGTTLAGGGLIASVADTGWSIRGVGDFNGDGKADILWRHTNGNNAIWLMNGLTLAGGGLIPSVPDPAWSIQGVGDFNGDGKDDILWRHANGSNAIWLMNGTTLAGGGLTTTVADTGWAIKGVGDFNGDGKADIVWRHADGRNAIWLMDGYTILSSALTTTVSDMGWSIQGVGDFNGSGKADILWRHTDGRTVVWLMDGFNLSNGAVVNTVPDAGWSIKGR